MHTIAGMEITVTMNTNLMNSAALEHTEDQMTMTNLAENTRKEYRPEIHRFFDDIGNSACQIGVEDVRGWNHRTIQFCLSNGDKGRFRCQLFGPVVCVQTCHDLSP